MVAAAKVCFGWGWIICAIWCSILLHPMMLTFFTPYNFCPVLRSIVTMIQIKQRAIAHS